MLSSFLSWWRGETGPGEALLDDEDVGRRRPRSPADYLFGANPGVSRYGGGRPTDSSHDSGNGVGSGWDGGGGDGGGADG